MQGQTDVIIVGIDIGGTFTDLMAFDESSNGFFQAKSLTTPKDLIQGIIDCINKCDLPVARIDQMIHGSTTAINTLIERKGARTALIVTRGTRDVYAIGRGNRPESYSIFFHRARPLVPRHLIFEVDERMIASGDVYKPLDLSQVRKLGELIAQGGGSPDARNIDAVAVCYLHSYANPEHERKTGEELHRMLNGRYISLSHEILREYREYERISTTVVNAYIGPTVATYVGNLESSLKTIGFTGDLSIMRSNGGVMAPSVAIERPVAMMESGPVGGIIASAMVGQKLGFDNVISFDMGGTTAKTSLIRNNELTMSEGYYVGGYASGDPVMSPVVDIVEVGAGGGSIAWIDEVRALKVGPQSSGADPGPICYGNGGTEPTITDANVILGRVGVSDFLGGEMKLDEASARSAFETKLGQILKMDVVSTADAIVQIAIAKMSLAVREVSVQKGYDPREFAMVASGGAGPLHAVAIARELHIPVVIIPRFPAHFSALGMLMADERHDLVRTYLAALDEVDFDALVKICKEMHAEAHAVLKEQRNVRTQIMVDLRYVGQEFSLSVPIELRQLEAHDAAGMRKAFDDLHERRYAHHAADEPVEMINVRLVAVGERARFEFPSVGQHGSGQVKVARRPVYMGRTDAPVDCAVYHRDRLAPGTEIAGPALIQEYASTTVMFGGDRCKVAETGEIVIILGSA
ncbi:MAG: hydantoinase/oxoprolinase family protein [Xanthobacteraceae bacterium]